MTIPLYEVDKYFHKILLVKTILNDNLTALTNGVQGFQAKVLEFDGHNDRSRNTIVKLIDEIEEIKETCVALFFNLNDMRIASNQEIESFMQLKNYILANSRNALNLFLFVYCHRALLITQAKIVDHNLFALAVIEILTKKSEEMQALIADDESDTDSDSDVDKDDEESNFEEQDDEDKDGEGHQDGEELEDDESSDDEEEDNEQPKDEVDSVADK